MARVCVMLAQGFEEIEAVTPIDVLKRAGLNVITAGLSGKRVTGAHGLAVEADIVLAECQTLPDAILLPGGMPGSKNLAESKELQVLIKKMHKQQKKVTAICAAPALVLAQSGVLDGKKATCYPGFENNFTKATQFSEKRVVVDGNVVTSRGPGSALEFSLEIVAQLVSKERAQELREGLLARS